jgi:hypothetical protein
MPEAFWHHRLDKLTFAFSPGQHADVTALTRALGDGSSVDLAAVRAFLNSHFPIAAPDACHILETLCSGRTMVTLLSALGQRPTVPTAHLPCEQADVWGCLADLFLASLPAISPPSAASAAAMAYRDPFTAQAAIVAERTAAAAKQLSSAALHPPSCLLAACKLLAQPAAVHSFRHAAQLHFASVGASQNSETHPAVQCYRVHETRTRRAIGDWAPRTSRGLASEGGWATLTAPHPSLTTKRPDAPHAGMPRSGPHVPPNYFTSGPRPVFSSAPFARPFGDAAMVGDESTDDPSSDEALPPAPPSQSRHACAATPPWVFDAFTVGFLLRDACRAFRLTRQERNCSQFLAEVARVSIHSWLPQT